MNGPVPLICLVAGARPNFMKIAPLVWELKKRHAKYKLVHTGQHYDYEMSKVFFEELDIPKPDYFLNAGSGSHGEQTAKIIIEFEKICRIDGPDIVVVVGDVNSTLACSITAKKFNIKVAHVEAGLRSGDMTMPEEINRIVTDSISDYLFVTEKSGINNLRREGKNEKQIFFVGNIMVDALFYGIEKIGSRNISSAKRSPFAVVTLHRPSNVDDKDKLADILMALKTISGDMPIYFPVHPRTAKNIKDFELNYLLENSRIRTMPPLPYLKFLALWKDAELVLTDSGGLQEETTALGVPCFTVRDNTERPITMEEGTNILVGTIKQTILDAYSKFKKGSRKKGKRPELWDGRTAERIVSVLLLK
jgi:UDP-N-acetylglucosamine 2-epimerase (non-hydrolysing)